MRPFLHLGVPVLEPEQLARLTITELSLRKAALLDCADDAARAEQYLSRRRPGVEIPDDHVFHRKDPRWLPQWLAARELAWQRRREHTVPVWCVVANIVRERPYGPGGAMTRRGTKHFPGGARVHVIDAHWGACEVVTVVGQRRRPLRWTRVAMGVEHLEGFRAKLVYDPNVIDGFHMYWQGSDTWNEARARDGESAFPRWAAEIRRSREAHRRGRPVLPAHLHGPLGGALGMGSHRVDLRLRDGRHLFDVPMSYAYFADRIDFAPDDVVDVQRAPDPGEWDEPLPE